MKEIVIAIRLCLIAAFISLAPHPVVQAADPLDAVSGTEDWDQVAPSQPAKTPTLSRSAFKREVAEWEFVRQLWHGSRADYLVQRKAHQTMSLPNPEFRQETMAESATTPALDRLIDDELDESGAVLDPETIRQQEEKKRKQEILENARKAVLEHRRKIAEERENKKNEEVEKRRLMKEEEEAGAAAALELMRLHEDQIKKEAEALREKANLDLDEEGQVVDPELKREMESEE